MTDRSRRASSARGPSAGDERPPLRRRFRLVLAIAAPLAVLGPPACDASDPIAPPEPTGDSGLRTCTDSAVDSEPDAGADSGDDPKYGSYRQGVNLCCGEGKGLACCPPEMLPDVDSGRDGLCFTFGGSLGHCAASGERIDATDECAFCCDGLAPTSSLRPSPNGFIVINGVTCELGEYQAGHTCLPCGNGSCDDGENACNCPNDCWSSGPGPDASVIEGGVTPPPPPPPPPPP